MKTLDTPDAPPLTDPERQLLVAVHRYARQHGWHQANGWFRDRDRTLFLDWWGYHRGNDTTLVIERGDRNGHPRLYHSEILVDSVSQAVDVLVSLGILPPRFHSIAIRARAAADLADHQLDDEDRDWAEVALDLIADIYAATHPSKKED